MPSFKRLLALTLAVSGVMSVAPMAQGAPGEKEVYAPYQNRAGSGSSQAAEEACVGQYSMREVPADSQSESFSGSVNGQADSPSISPQDVSLLANEVPLSEGFTLLEDSDDTQNSDDFSVGEAQVGDPIVPSQEVATADDSDGPLVQPIQDIKDAATGVATEIQDQVVTRVPFMGSDSSFNSPLQNFDLKVPDAFAEFGQSVLPFIQGTSAFSGFLGDTGSEAQNPVNGSSSSELFTENVLTVPNNLIQEIENDAFLNRMEQPLTSQISAIVATIPAQSVAASIFGSITQKIRRVAAGVGIEAFADQEPLNRIGTTDLVASDPFSFTKIDFPFDIAGLLSNIINLDIRDFLPSIDIEGFPSIEIDWSALFIPVVIIAGPIIVIGGVTGAIIGALTGLIPGGIIGALLGPILGAIFGFLIAAIPGLLLGGLPGFLLGLIPGAILGAFPGALLGALILGIPGAIISGILGALFGGLIGTILGLVFALAFPVLVALLATLVGALLISIIPTIVGAIIGGIIGTLVGIGLGLLLGAALPFLKEAGLVVFPIIGGLLGLWIGTTLGGTIGFSISYLLGLLIVAPLTIPLGLLLGLLAGLLILPPLMGILGALLGGILSGLVGGILLAIFGAILGGLLGGGLGAILLGLIGGLITGLIPGLLTGLLGILPGILIGSILGPILGAIFGAIFGAILGWIVGIIPGIIAGVLVAIPLFIIAFWLTVILSIPWIIVNWPDWDSWRIYWDWDVKIHWQRGIGPGHWAVEIHGLWGIVNCKTGESSEQQLHWCVDERGLRWGRNCPDVEDPLHQEPVEHEIRWCIGSSPWGINVGAGCRNNPLSQDGNSEKNLSAGGRGISSPVFPGLRENKVLYGGLM